MVATNGSPKVAPCVGLVVSLSSKLFFCTIVSCGGTGSAFVLGWRPGWWWWHHHASAGGGGVQDATAGFLRTARWRHLTRSSSLYGQRREEAAKVGLVQSAIKNARHARGGGGGDWPTLVLSVPTHMPSRIVRALLEWNIPSKSRVASAPADRNRSLNPPAGVDG